MPVIWVSWCRWNCGVPTTVALASATSLAAQASGWRAGRGGCSADSTLTLLVAERRSGRRRHGTPRHPRCRLPRRVVTPCSDAGRPVDLVWVPAGPSGPGRLFPCAARRCIRRLFPVGMQRRKDLASGAGNDHCRNRCDNRRERKTRRVGAGHEFGHGNGDCGGRGPCHTDPRDQPCHVADAVGVSALCRHRCDQRAGGDQAPDPGEYASERRVFLLCSRHEVGEKTLMTITAAQMTVSAVAASQGSIIQPRCTGAVGIWREEVLMLMSPPFIRAVDGVPLAAHVSAQAECQASSLRKSSRSFTRAVLSTRFRFVAAENRAGDSAARRCR